MENSLTIGRATHQEPANQTPTMLEVSEECEELAQFYQNSGILPAKKIEDALHVALATIHQMDILVSWNHRHMANVRKAEQYQAANLIWGTEKHLSS